MNGVYKVRAYCENRECDYIHEPDILRAINHESAFAGAQLLNGHADRPACPQCGSLLHYYPFCTVGVVADC